MDIVVVLPNPCSQGRDEEANFFAGQHLIKPGLLHIEDFSFEGKDGLEGSIPALLGGAPSGIAFYNIDLAERGVPFLAFGQFSGKGVSPQGPLLTATFSRLPSRFPPP